MGSSRSTTLLDGEDLRCEYKMYIAYQSKLLLFDEQSEVLDSIKLC